MAQMDFYKDFPERSDTGTATTPDGNIVVGNDKLNDNDYALVGANGTGSSSQGKGYKVKFLSIYNYIKSKMLVDKKMIATKDSNGLISLNDYRTLPMLEPTGSVLKSKVYIINNTRSNSFVGKAGFISFHRSFMCDITALVTGSSQSVPQEILVSNIISNIDAQSIKFYRRYDILIIELQVAMGGNYANGFALSYTGADATVSLDEKYAYNAATDTDLKIAVIPKQQTQTASYVAERYSMDEEQALTRRMIANDPTVVEQFEAYNTYCEECKARAKEELANQPQVLPADAIKTKSKQE